MNPGTKSQPWFALYTRHHHEKTVAQFLTNASVRTFMPLYNVAHRWKDRVKQLAMPLFPNYVFVCAGPEQRVGILRTPGIYDFVRTAGQPSPIPGEEIEAIRLAVENGLSVEPHPFLNTGDRVRAKSGPLKGLEGVLVRKKGFYRLILSVELLARSIAVEGDAVDFERVPERPWRIVPGGDFVTAANLRC